jgi:putative NADH-flavin reductase
MAKISIIGGTGYAGRHITAEAARRGHDVTVLSRSIPENRVDGVAYRSLDVLDEAALPEALAGAEVIVSALSPRGALEGRIAEVDRATAAQAQAQGARLGVVGGAGSLRVGEDGPLVVDTPDFPAAVIPEAKEMGVVLDELRAWDPALDWFFVSPAGGFGAWAEGEHTGVFRLGGDVLLVDSEGKSEISGADFAQAFVDEIEAPRHSRARFTVAY